MFVSSPSHRLRTATLPLFDDRIEYSPGVAMLHPASRHWVPLRWVRSRESEKLAPKDLQREITKQDSQGKRMPQRVEDVDEHSSSDWKQVRAVTAPRARATAGDRHLEWSFEARYRQGQTRRKSGTQSNRSTRARALRQRGCQISESRRCRYGTDVLCVREYTDDWLGRGSDRVSPLEISRRAQAPEDVTRAVRCRRRLSGSGCSGAGCWRW